MKYAKSNKIATLGFECRKTTMLATRQKKRFKPQRGVHLKKTKAVNKEILKHYLHIAFDKVDLDSNQYIRKVV